MTSEKFCPNCHILVSGDCCPVCFREQLYTPLPEDFCLLTEQEAPWFSILGDCLRDNDIAYTEESAVGAWVTSRAGIAFERKRFYVPYEKLELAKALVEELFHGEIVDEAD